jgi:hypothetical protein
MSLNLFKVCSSHTAVPLKITAFFQLSFFSCRRKLRAELSCAKWNENGVEERGEERKKFVVLTIKLTKLFQTLFEILIKQFHPPIQNTSHLCRKQATKKRR